SQSDSWSIYFDGGDVLLAATDVDAFHLLDNGEILMSVESPILIAGLGTVDDSDIVRFIPTSLGNVTDGTFVMYKTAAELGLNPASEKMDIDAIGFTPEGKLLFSIADQVNLPGFQYKDQDLILFEEGVGTSLYFDGSDVGMNGSTENITGTWVNSETGNIYLTTEGNFNVVGSEGDGADVFMCHPNSTGTNTNCIFGPGLFWNGGAHHFANVEIDGLAINLSEVIPDIEVPGGSVGNDDAGPYAADPAVTACSANNSFYATNWNEIYFGHCPNDDEPIVSGFRFGNVTLPPGAVIEQARLEFTVDGQYVEELYLQIQGTLAVTTNIFDGLNRPDTQAPLTQATVLWHIPSSDVWDTYETTQTPDLVTIIQEIVDQGGWQSGNAMTLIVKPQPNTTPGGDRRVFAWDRYQTTLYAAKLQIWYHVP
ncbi:MAG: hypothetical protein GY943_01270, partial [Chloroflexi bacterium]|nr:hypothetical protein [Chloroflexota bacterium]